MKTRCSRSLDSLEALDLKTQAEPDAKTLQSVPHAEPSDGICSNPAGVLGYSQLQA